MVETKKGLRYEIILELEGFKELRQVRTELDRVRRGWRKLKTDVARTRPELKKLAALQTKNALEQQKLVAKVAAENAKAQIQIQRARREQALTERQLLKNRFAHQKLAAAQDRTARKANKAARAQRVLRKELTQTGSRANRVSFTFRRLFGIFAAFAAIRIVSQKFKEAISSGQNFNAFVEQSKLGIQSLLAAAANVYGPDGILITGPAKFAALQAEAGRQTRLLEKDARESAATYEQLVEAFQIGLGPGLRAGLDVDDIRKLALVVSQAAAAIGLPMNQLNEEIRSLLAGTITQRTTRIAAVLGITNEDIRRWTQAGSLAQNLFKRFEAFEIASSTAVKNFNVILTNLGATFRKTLGEASIGAFTNLKNDLTALMDVLQEGGADTFAAEVENLLQAGLDVARELAAAVNFDDAAGVLRLVIDLLRGGAAIAGAMLQGVAAAAKIISGAIRDFVGLLTSLGSAVDNLVGIDISGAFGKALTFMLASVVAIKILVAFTGTLVFLWNSIKIKAFIVGLINIVRLTKSWVTQMVFISGIWKGLFLSLAGPLLVLTVVGFLISQLADDTEKTASAAAALTAKFDVASVAIRATSKALQDQVELVQKIVEETQKLKDEFSLADAAKGLEGAAAKFEKTLQKGLNETRERTKKLTEEEVAAREKMAELEADRVTVTAKLAGFEKATADQIEKSRARVVSLVDAKKLVLDRAEKVAEVERRIASDELTRLGTGQQELKTAKEQLAEALKLQSIIETIKSDNEDELAIKRDLLDLAKSEFQLGNEVQAQEEQIKALVEGRKKLEDAQRDKLAEQLSVLALQSAELSKQVLLQERLKERGGRVDLAAFGGDKLQSQLLKAEVQMLLLEAANKRQVRLATEQALKADEMAQSLKDAGVSQNQLGNAVDHSANSWLIVASITRQVNNNIDLARKKIDRLRNLLAIDKSLRSFERTAADLLLVKSSAQKAEATVRPFRNALEDAQRTLQELPGTTASAEILAISNAMVRAQRATRALTQSNQANVQRLQRDADLLSQKFDNLGKDVLSLAEISKSREIALKTLPELIEQLRSGNTHIISQMDSMFIALNLEEEIRTQIKKKLLEIVSLGTKERDLKLQMVALSNAEGLAIDFIRKTLQVVTVLEARRLAITRERANIILKAQLAAARAEQSARGGNQTQQRKAQLEGELVVLQAEETVLQKQHATERDILATKLSTAKTDEERAAIHAAINALLAEHDLRMASIEVRTDNVKDDLLRIGDGSFGDGIAEGFRRAEEGLDLFETAVQGVQEIIDGLAQIGADAIVNLLDPENYEDIGDQLISLFKNVVAAIIAEFLKLAIIKAVAQLGGAAASGSGGGTARGGRIGHGRSARPGLAHAYAQGYSRGGGLRPRGMDPRDVIPAWLRAGEWVLTPERVARYRELVGAIHTGKLDPDLARSMASSAGAGPVTPRAAPGYAEGGPVGGATGSDRGEQVIVIDSEENVDAGLSLEVGREHANKFGGRRTLRNVRRGR